MNKVYELANSLRENVKKVVVGKEKIIDLLIAALLANGHVLLEDMPGTGKTMMAKAMAKSILGDSKRVQFTPDLMPSDITGINVYKSKKEEFELVKGPVFTNILLADEINRATPRTQSSLLEAMEETQVTIDGDTLPLSKVFMVVATENPIETTGTYPLPEAELDRFIMKLSMGDMSKEEELAVLDRFITENPIENIESVCTLEQINEARELVKKVFVHECVRNYLVDIIFATREANQFASGVSTRGTLAMLRVCQSYAAMQGRDYVEPDDVKYLAPFVLGHRVLSLGARSYQQRIKAIEEIVETVPVPVEDWKK